jgi:hypothetical protein
MMTLARKHKARVLSEIEAKNGDPVSNGQPRKTAPQAELMAAQLRAHRMELKKVKSTPTKIIKKREFIHEYLDYVDGVIAADTGKQDDVLMFILVWALDIGMFDRALDMATYALMHDLKMPEPFKRDVQDVLIEQLAEYALLHKDDADQKDMLLRDLNIAMSLVSDLDMTDQVLSKAYKALGLLYQDNDLSKAVENLQLALDFDETCGVKTILNKLKKQVEPPQET